MHPFSALRVRVQTAKLRQFNDCVLRGPCRVYLEVWRFAAMRRVWNPKRLSAMVAAPASELAEWIIALLTIGRRI